MLLGTSKLGNRDEIRNLLRNDTDRRVVVVVGGDLDSFGEQGDVAGAGYLVVADCTVCLHFNSARSV